MKRLQAVVFDWAGATVDHGSLAPVKAVTGLFARHGIELSDTDARRDMGLFKKDHIRRILALPHVGTGWRTKKGCPPDEPDVDALFGEFAPIQMEILAAHSQLIAGTADIAERLRGRGMKIGSTTGYTRPIARFIIGSRGRAGLHPRCRAVPG
jgi:phosphonoacetaldehyde hydrolase